MAVQLQSFETVWPALSGRLKRVLQSRRVPEECVDDVIQETGLRLLRNWDTVDQSTIWSFTLTVAGNIIKDDMRRRARDEKFTQSLPPNNYVDIEERALARVELWKTHRAIDTLSSVQRTAILTEVYGFDGAGAVNAGAAKMSRLRARRRLRQTLGRASGLIALGGHRLRRIMFGDPRGGLTESASHTVAAALLIAAGVDLMMLGGGVFQSHAGLDAGRYAFQAPSDTSRAANHDSTGGSAGRASGLVASPGRIPPAAMGAGDVSDPVLDHEESVGPNGASGSLQSTLLGQRTSLDIQAERRAGTCQGTRSSSTCAGTVTAQGAAHHNGKTYGARAGTDGEVRVQGPYNVGL